MKKIVTLAVAAAMCVGIFAGCSSQSANDAAASEEPAATQEAQEETAAPEEEASELTGTVSMSGSTSMETIANALAEGFMAENPGVEVTVQLGGSSVGIQDVIAGKVDIGNASRELKDEETAEGATPNVIAIDGIAIVVNPANGVEDITKDQLISIYKGEIKNWSELGGEDMPIVVIGREASSGTRGAFEEILGIEDACKYAQELNETGAVKTTVSTTPAAIGYVSLEALDDTVKALSLDGAQPTAEAIKDGSYALSRPFIMATCGEVSPVAQAFLDYVLGDAGQALVADNSLITVK